MSNSTFLGFTDEPISFECRIDSNTSKIGGNAVVDGGRRIQLLCEVCRSSLCRLVCQIYCPVDQVFHRTLYIFCCPSPLCHRDSRGWRVLRIQTPIAKPGVKGHLKAKSSDDGDKCDGWNDGSANDWGGAAAEVWGDEPANGWNSESAYGCGDESANGWNDEPANGWNDEPANGWNGEKPADRETQRPDFGSEGKSADSVLIGVKSANTLEKKLESTASPVVVGVEDLLSSVEGLTIDDQEHVAYDSYYISVADESEFTHRELLRKEDKQLLETLEHQIDYSDNRKSGGRKVSAATEHYEKSEITHGNRTFYKFTKTLSKSPNQIIRYSFGGRPLPMTPIDGETIIRCSNCGATRMFELQLMPALVQSLCVAAQPAPLDVGTVMVFSCSQNCWDGHAIMEAVYVQNDPDEGLINQKLLK